MGILIIGSVLGLIIFVLLTVIIYRESDITQKYLLVPVWLFVLFMYIWFIIATDKLEKYKCSPSIQYELEKDKLDKAKAEFEEYLNKHPEFREREE